jgi:hypothetical protein
MWPIIKFKLLEDILILLKAVSGLGLAALAYAGATGGLKPAERHFAFAKPKAPPVITIIARDYTYDPIPDVPAGVVDIRLHNVGPDIHHAAIFKLGAGKTASDLAAALKKPGPPPSWAEPVAGPNAPVLGEYSNEIVTLSPGNYVAMCFVNTNGGIPHFVKGMVRAFKVVPSKNKAKEPSPDTHIELFDYNFKFSKPVTAGRHTFHVMNSGPQVHEIELFQLAPGKTLAELVTWLSGPMSGPPPGKPMGGIVNMPPGGHALFRQTMVAGEWAAICFIPDAKDGKPHFMHGMELQFSVK